MSAGSWYRSDDSLDAYNFVSCSTTLRAFSCASLIERGWQNMNIRLIAWPEEIMSLGNRENFVSLNSYAEVQAEWRRSSDKKMELIRHKCWYIIETSLSVDKQHWQRSRLAFSFLNNMSTSIEKVRLVYMEHRPLSQRHEHNNWGIIHDLLYYAAISPDTRIIFMFLIDNMLRVIEVGGSDD